MIGDGDNNSRRRESRLLVVVGILTFLGIVYGIGYWALAPILVPRLEGACFRSLTDTTGIRIESYSSGGSPQVFRITHDAGLTWDEFFRINGDSGSLGANCERHITVANPTTFQITASGYYAGRNRWEEYTLSSTDGGQTWQVRLHE